MSRMFESEYGRYYQNCRDAFLSLAEQNCSPDAGRQEVENAVYKAYCTFEDTYSYPEGHIMSVSEELGLWLEQQLGSVFSAPGKVEGSRRLKLLDALRQLYRQVRDGEVEYQNSLVNSAAIVGAGLGTVPISCAPPVLERIAEVGKFIAKHEVIYL